MGDSVKVNLTDVENASKHGIYEDHFLIATPNLMGSIFEKSVIYMVTHNKDGAMGLIVNQEVADTTLTEMMEQLDMSVPYSEEDMPVYFGGPVEVGKGFVLHSDDYAKHMIGEGAPLRNKSGICLSSHMHVLEDLAHRRGPEKSRVVLGYAGWSAGQLEKEMEENAWFSVPARSELLFDESDGAMWERISKYIGVDPILFSSEAGHA